MMKRIFSSALLVALLALTGCGNKEEKKAETVKTKATVVAERNVISDEELEKLRLEEEAAIRALENLLNEASENDQFAWLDSINEDALVENLEEERAALAHAVGMGADKFEDFAAPSFELSEEDATFAFNDLDEEAEFGA